MKRSLRALFFDLFTDKREAFIRVSLKSASIGIILNIASSYELNKLKRETK